MNIQVLSNDELVNAAILSDNPMANRLASIIETLENEGIDEYTEFKEAMADHFASELNEKIDTHIQEYYLNTEGDYVTGLDYIATESIHDSDITRLVNELEQNVTDPYERQITGLTEESEQYLINLGQTDIDDLTIAICRDIGASCNIEVTQSPFHMVAYALYGFSIGEPSEEKEEWFSDIPDEIKKQVEENLNHTVKDDQIYFNLSDCFIHWVIDIEWLEDWATEQLEEKEE